MSTEQVIERASKLIKEDSKYSAEKKQRSPNKDKY